MNPETKRIIQAMGGIFSVLFVLFAWYGSYRWYFKRPAQTVVNNTYEYKNYTMSGDNATVVEAPKEKRIDRRLMTGVWGDKDTIGGFVGWLW